MNRVDLFRQNSKLVHKFVLTPQFLMQPNFPHKLRLSNFLFLVNILRTFVTNQCSDLLDRIAFVTLNRPERLNAISMTLPGALRLAIETANEDDNVHVIVLQGNGRAFCSGYDLSIAGKQYDRTRD